MMIVKIGGGAAINLAGIAADLAAIAEPVLVVHGANALRDDLAARLGVPPRILHSPSGFDSVYSDASAIDLLMLAYAGLRNKRFVEMCLQNGLQAIGLTGLDGALIRGRRNEGFRYYEEGKTRIARDLSGKPHTVNRLLLDRLLSGGCLPVLTVPIADETGTAINSDNDDIVGVLQCEMRAERVVQLIEAPGILRDARDPESRIAELDPEQLRVLEASLAGRMKRKIHALRTLVESAPATVYIGDGRVASPLAGALAGGGTVLRMSDA